MSNFSRLLNASARITFWTLHVIANFVFRLFNVSLSFRAQSPKKRVCDLPFSISVKSYRTFSKKRVKIYGVFVEKSLSLKTYFEGKDSQTGFCCLCVNLPTIKIWGQSDKFPVSFSVLQCPLQVKKLIWENSAKYVTQTGNFYFRHSLTIFNLFQRFLLYIRDFIWIITLTEKSKFEENCRSEGIL